MARRKLTDEERHFKRIGSGNPVSRWWPVIAIVAGLGIAAINPEFVDECTGLSFDDYNSRTSGRIAALFAYPCSPYLLREGIAGWLIFMALWWPWPFAIINYRWARRQRKFWNGERLREARRCEKKQV